MKKKSIFKTLVVGLILSVSTILPAQVIIIGVSDSTALIDQDFSATVTENHLGASPTFSLVTKPTGMTIGSSTGIISWHPTGIDQGGKVVVRCSNPGGPDTLTFHVYVSDAVVCSADLISYYKLDETSGTNFVDYANAHDATLLGSLDDTIGKVGKAQMFKPSSATAQFLTVPDADQYEWTVAQDFSYSFWIYSYGNNGFALATDDQVIMSREELPAAMNLIGLDCQAANTLYPKWRLISNGLEQNIITTSPLTLKTWHHMAFVYDATSVSAGNQNATMKIYIDGVQAVTGAKTFNEGKDFFMASPMSIGYYPPQITEKFPFNGKLDEFLVYNKALSGSDVSAIYTDGIAGEAHCKPGNHAPQFINEFPVTVNQGSLYSVKLVGSDVDGDNLVIDDSLVPSWLTYNNGTKILSGTPGNSAVGSNPVILKLTENKVDGLTILYSYSITVNNINDVPVITSTATTTGTEDIAYSYTLTYSDVDAGDVVTLSAPVKPAWMNFNTSTGVLSFTATDVQLGTTPYVDYNITLRVQDVANTFDEQSFVIRVTNVNDLPNITGQNSLTVLEDNSLAITTAVFTKDVNLTDPDDTYPDDFTVTVQNGTNYTHVGNTITPALNYSGSLTVPVKVNDGNTDVDYSLAVSVTSVNDKPTYNTSPSVNAKEGILYSYIINIDDVDVSDILNISISKKASWLGFNYTAGQKTAVLAGTPSNSNVGADSVVIIASDNQGGSTYQRYLLTVENENNAPVITSTPIKVGDDYEYYEYQLTASDPDLGDVLSYTAPTLPSWLNFNSTTHVLSGTPKYNHTGNNTVVLRVTDGFEVAKDSFVIVVGNTNSSPEITSTASTSANVSQLYTYNITATDDDEDDVLTYTAPTVPSWLSFTASTKILFGTPTSENLGAHNITLEVNDGHEAVQQSYTLYVVTTGIDNNSLGTVTVYPTPAQDLLHIDFAGMLTGNQIQLLDLNGRILEQQTIETSTGSIIFDLSDYKSGMYLYRILSDLNVSTGKFMVE